jgi:rfaE bifunctional protein nucleotidyltransferase chain/domain
MAIYNDMIIPIDKIQETVIKLRQAGVKSIAFTNGCFDILHRGHVEYLEKARATADILIVGINSDASVRRLKGDERPYIPQEDRAFILSRLKAVDLVCIFEEDTPFELIKRVQPDVLVKGGDYQLDEIVGRDIVVKNGGQVLTIPLVFGRSTTNLIEKIRLTCK